MTWAHHDSARGLDDLRAAVLDVLGLRPRPAGIPAWVLLSEAAVSGSSAPGGDHDDSDRAVSSEETEAERRRLIALV
jgi:hypothetical protein